MSNYYTKIDDALIMAGLTPTQVSQIKQGEPIFGESGLLDSLGLVRLISAVSTSFEDVGVDMFDMMFELDVEAIDAFATRDTINAFLTRVIGAQVPAVA